MALCVFLFALAFVPRFGYALLQRDDALGGDEVEYDALAVGLNQRGVFTSQPGFSLAYYSPGEYAPTAFRPPLFPVMLAATYSVFGHYYFPVRVLLAALNAFGAILVFLITFELYQDRRISAIAGVAWALWPASIYYDGTASTTLLTEGLAVPLMLAGLLLLARSRRRASLFSVAAAGAVLAVCALGRFNLILVIPFAVVWLLFVWWKLHGRTSAGLACAVMVMACIVVISPWVVRNYLTLGVATVATQSDVIFFGNNAWTRGAFNSEEGRMSSDITFDPTAASDSRSGENNDIIRHDAAHLQTEQFRYLEERYPNFFMRSEAEKSAIYRREGVSYILENKRRMVWVLYRKALMFWLPLHEVSGRNGYSFAYAFMIPFFAVGCASAVRGRDAGALLMLVPVLACFATEMIALSHPRYRYPGEPAMLILAAIGVGVLARRISWRHTAIIAVMWLTINIGVAFALTDNRIGLQEDVQISEKEKNELAPGGSSSESLIGAFGSTGCCIYTASHNREIGV